MNEVTNLGQEVEKVVGDSIPVILCLDTGILIRRHTLHERPRVIGVALHPVGSGDPGEG